MNTIVPRAAIFGRQIFGAFDDVEKNNFEEELRYSHFTKLTEYE